jgi:hypothetical protein
MGSVATVMQRIVSASTTIETKAELPGGGNMNEPYEYDAMKSAVHFAAELKEVFQPPDRGASLSAILGVAIVTRILREAGFVVVPLNPTLEMERAYQDGWFRPFFKRYASMLRAAAWPEAPVDEAQSKAAPTF